jgi:peptidoglycan/xylan/chitin deacetylase (PgdA/CDA1 family)
VLSWDALRRLAGEGVVLGAHTQTHPLLNRIPAVQARAEIAGSLRDLQREVGTTSDIFAYPDGQYTREVVQAVREAGVRLAFTTQRGAIDINQPDHFHLRRNNIGRQATQPVLRARLLQATIHLDRFRPIPSH